MKSLFRTLSLSALLLAGAVTHAQAQILLAPTRVVLEDGAKSADLTILNNGTDEAAFRISIENRRMLENGTLETAEDTRDGEKFAKDMIRFSPRRVTLTPNAQQTIRISSRLPKGLEPGEYRSHLRVMAAPLNAGQNLDSLTAESDSGKLSIQLVAIQSVTIPVIIRVGKLEGEVAITSVNVEPATENEDAVIVAKLERTGDQSVYGDFKIFAEGEIDPVYEARGIAVYVPNQKRDLVLPMPEEISSRLKGKKLRIDYTTTDVENPVVLASLQTKLIE